MSYLDSRIVILNSAHGLSYNGTYKSDIEFQFNGLLKQEDTTSSNITSKCSICCFMVYYKVYEQCI